MCAQVSLFFAVCRNIQLKFQESLMLPLPSTSEGYTALTSDGLLLKRVIKSSSSTEGPKSSNKVHVHYDGTLWNEAHTPFDSSRNRPGDFSFTLGQGQVIKGWDIGVASMKKGETCELICSHEYGNGRPCHTKQTRAGRHACMRLA